MFARRRFVLTVGHGIDRDVWLVRQVMGDLMRRSHAIIGAFAFIKCGPVLIRDRGDQTIYGCSGIPHHSQVRHAAQGRVAPHATPARKGCRLCAAEPVRVAVNKAAIAKEI